MKDRFTFNGVDEYSSVTAEIYYFLTKRKFPLRKTFQYISFQEQRFRNINEPEGAQFCKKILNFLHKYGKF